MSFGRADRAAPFSQLRERKHGASPTSFADLVHGTGRPPTPNGPHRYPVRAFAMDSAEKQALASAAGLEDPTSVAQRTEWMECLSKKKEIQNLYGRSSPMESFLTASARPRSGSWTRDSPGGSEFTIGEGKRDIERASSVSARRCVRINSRPSTARVSRGGTSTSAFSAAQFGAVARPAERRPTSAVKVMPTRPMVSRPSSARPSVVRPSSARPSSAQSSIVSEGVLLVTGQGIDASVTSRPSTGSLNDERSGVVSRPSSALRSKREDVSHDANWDDDGGDTGDDGACLFPSRPSTAGQSSTVSGGDGSRPSSAARTRKELSYADGFEAMCADGGGDEDGSRLSSSTFSTGGSLNSPASRRPSRGSDACVSDYGLDMVHCSDSELKRIALGKDTLSTAVATVRRRAERDPLGSRGAGSRGGMSRQRGL
eukprot:TRINITY_DN74419_c0_g1_i1.p1 TRINITY_DN74419_c0_g1~~TRINITY_DN74419_c0_g1_i1.p1  ORF type:complete len:428 (-),score=49.39 TRINITY_DN74419_c0_g1_i1:93-1376(-)